MNKPSLDIKINITKKRRKTMASALNFNSLSYLFVSGASRGIGKAIAVEFSKKLQSGSRIVIAARNAELLEKTKSEISESNQSVEVLPYTIDLGTSTEQDLTHLIKDSASNGTNYEQGIIVHNVGTTGDVSKKAKECSNLKAWEENFRLNVFNVACVNNAFLNEFKDKKRYVYNLSAKAAFMPFESFGMYCPNKAARHMYFKVLSEEEKRDKNLVILQYYPGPVDTEMTANMELNSCSAGLKNFFKNSKKTGQIMSPEQTTKALFEIIEKGNFRSGDFMDYHAHKIEVKV